MNLLDMRTVILSYTVSNLVCLVVIAILWRWNNRCFSGLGFWLADFLLQFLSLGLFVLRGVIPDFLSMTVSNTMVIGGTLLLYIGLEHFTGKRGRQIHNYTLLVIFIIAHAYFVFIFPSLAARNLLISLGLLIICSQCAWLMLRRVAPELRSSMRSVGYVFVAFCLVSLGRIVVTMFAPPGNDFFRSNAYDTLLLVTYQMLFIILTFSLFLLVNYRLFVDLQDDIAVRKQTEKALTERIKELSCFYDLSSLINTPGISLESILHTSVSLLPPAMQYPEFACARIIIEGQSYVTENYQDSSRKLSCDVRRHGQVIGSLDVCYQEDWYHTEEQLFLEEEVNFLKDVAERLSQVIDRWHATEALQKSEERYQVFISQSFEAIYRTEFDHPIDISLPVETQIDQIYQNAYMAECNQALADMYNLPSTDTMIGMRLLDAHGGSDNPINRAAFRKFIEGGYKSTNDETVEEDRLGNPVWFLSNTIGIVENGFLVRLWGTSIDFTERKRVEAALMQAKQQAEESEVRFRQSLELSPVPTALTDSKGRLIFLNKQFIDTYGYTLQDIQTIPQWFVLAYPDSEYRAVVLKEWETDVEDAVKNHVLTPVREYRVVCKTGEVKTVEVSAYFEGDLAIGLFHDVSDRKYTEGITQLRLRLWEFSVSHPVEELMQKALDEICNITGSPIGFYHFVEEDQNMLSLQAWSTRTQAEFCKAEGAGMHYPISEAGVWVDCIRERKPVIHNDYASLPDRKGMPEGHAAVVRELVIPTMRGGRVVSILGVGNKPFDYNEQDIKLVSYIADIVWTIVEHKQAEERIHQLNNRLERLAMTDELTGLANRRSFFLQGEAEIQRVLRYPAPLSLLMLDIDRFKSINDTYGHAVGDLILQRIADTLRVHIRETDVVARLGGEEFGILLLCTQAAGAVELAERLRLAVEQESYEFQGQRIRATISVGVAEYRSDMPDLDAVLHKADAAMYQAKSQGRNQVVCLD